MKKTQKIRRKQNREFKRQLKRKQEFDLNEIKKEFQNKNFKEMTRGRQYT